MATYMSVSMAVGIRLKPEDWGREEISEFQRGHLTALKKLL